MAFLKIFVVEMLHHKGCELAIKVMEEDDITVSNLVEHRYKVTFTVCCSLRSLHDRDY